MKLEEDALIRVYVELVDTESIRRAVLFNSPF